MPWLESGYYQQTLFPEDWVCLVNCAKAGADWQSRNVGLSAAFLSYVETRRGGFRRKDGMRQAIDSAGRWYRFMPGVGKLKAERIAQFQRGRLRCCPGCSEDQDHKMILLLEYLCQSGSPRISLAMRAGQGC